ncbi:MAG: glyoxylate/hydroxypyruvate reductase A [Alphaproteobacteria bacterium]|nr:glyoxylate/hydroxypyruvate reductase A [Alphaproteobacteria bacterium]MBU0805389.1 glyoxylate/hydroxypyruvate reductase A [Alphaproteobacteria bacterium]MBU0873335.1 glyoxylate/hydroxypyruvate reductase A [Alphaproteobacteria bacterium]MBU1401437.1 glyoxylate/hydroxypyruvate reductase A [Alphaproteobacteria bacterium]MBU1592146.1 glyoxylate/hydroxypyruvate reductase A [Alphaproteobacteria bacterium]
MSIVVYLGDAEETREWIGLLSRLMPDHEIRDFDDPGQLSAVEYAVVWAPPRGGIARFPNLKAVVSVGAGVDHVLRDPNLPKHLPILRTTGPDMVQRLREYVALHVLAHHRELATTDASQARGEWRQIVTPVAGRRRVGVMGLGNIARACARTLVDLGFDTAGWSRSGRQVDGVTVFAGADGLPAFLAQTEILVCLLPLTPETRDILDSRLFAQLPKGARLINAGRGGHLVEDDLLAALDSGRLGGATLDVFRTEPLPADHPFWGHPRIRITPHIASMIDAETGASVIAENIRCFERTGASDAVADPKRGY